MFVIKAVEFLMLDLSIILVQQDLMEFYQRKVTYDLYTKHVESDEEYIDVKLYWYNKFCTQVCDGTIYLGILMFNVGTIYFTYRSQICYVVSFTYC